MSVRTTRYPSTVHRAPVIVIFHRLCAAMTRTRDDLSMSDRGSMIDTGLQLLKERNEMHQTGTFILVLSSPIYNTATTEADERGI